MSNITNWAITNGAPRTQWTCICSNSTGQYLAAGNSGGGVFVSSDYGANWAQTLTFANGVTCVCSNSTGEYFVACTGNGTDRIKVSIDFGQTWSTLSDSPAEATGWIASSATFSYIYIYVISANYIYKYVNMGPRAIIVTDVTIPNCRICTNSTGQYVTYILGTNIYTSNNYGNTGSFNIITPPFGVVTWRSICSDSTGKYLSACGDSSYIYTSNDYGESWTPNTYQKNWTSICSNSTGKYLYAVASGDGIYTSWDYGETWSLSYSNSSYWTSVCSNYSGTKLVAGATPNNYIYLGNALIPYPCFKEDTLILTDKGYKPVQTLRKGNLVKTAIHGFLKIDMIGKTELDHKACTENRIKNQLYKYSKETIEEVFEPLILTGCHSVLVSDFVSEEEKQKAIEINENRLCVTDYKYRLPACVDKRASVYEIPGKYTIYHLALENDNYYTNYGIYANGLLVESCSKRYLKELSNMELL